MSTSLQRHLDRHNNVTYDCVHCSNKFSQKVTLQRHINNFHSTNDSTPSEDLTLVSPAPSSHTFTSPAFSAIAPSPTFSSIALQSVTKSFSQQNATIRPSKLFSPTNTFHIGSRNGSFPSMVKSLTTTVRSEPTRTNVPLEATDNIADTISRTKKKKHIFRFNWKKNPQAMINNARYKQQQKGLNTKNKDTVKANEIGNTFFTTFST